MDSGNVKDLLVNGRRYIEIKRLYGVGRYLPFGEGGQTWIATILGWHDGSRHAGSGGTADEALADLADVCDTTVEWMRANCTIDILEK